jgi:hypothetical protein
MMNPPGYGSTPHRGFFCKTTSPRLLWPRLPHALWHDKRKLAVLLNHFVGGRKHRRRDTDAEGLGSLEIDKKIQPDRLMARQLGAPSSFEKIIDINA